jgi:hypothetical protein
MSRHCVGSTCACDIPLTCGGSTVCGSWDFETGTENWTIDPLVPSGSDGTAPVSTTAQHHGGGSRSLAVGTVGGSTFDFGITLCGGQTSDMSTLHYISAWMLIVPDVGAPPLLTDAVITFHWYYGPNVGDYIETDVNSVVPGIWTKIVGNLANSHSDIERIDVELFVSPMMGTWHGITYLDEVRLSMVPQ